VMKADFPASLLQNLTLQKSV